MEKKHKTVAILLLISVIGMFMVGCQKPPIDNSYADIVDLTGNIGVVIDPDIESAEIAASENKTQITDFGLRLLKSTYSNDNVLVSPLSVLYALGMTTNGAGGNTETEFLSALGFSDIHSLNGTMLGYTSIKDSYIEDSEKPVDFHLANSIWFTNDEKLTVKDEFLATNEAYYKAGIFKTVFDEKGRVTINNWISENTHDMINDMIKEMPEEAIMYLVNALAFEAEWWDPYFDEQVHDGTFYGHSGEEDAEFMTSTEYGYIEDDSATGFIKYYRGGNYAFAAILPNEDVSMSYYLTGSDAGDSHHPHAETYSDNLANGITGEHLQELLNGIDLNQEVIATMPKFKSESALSLVEAFKSMGVHDAFDVGNADFSNLGEYEGKNILIGDILHNTFIEVDQKGTKAGAATVVEMVAESAMIDQEPPKEVRLDRPFIYMIVDMNQRVPIFMGVEMNL